MCPLLKYHKDLEVDLVSGGRLGWRQFDPSLGSDIQVDLGSQDMSGSLPPSPSLSWTHHHTKRNLKSQKLKRQLPRGQWAQWPCWIHRGTVLYGMPRYAIASNPNSKLEMIRNKTWAFPRWWLQPGPWVHFLKKSTNCFFFLVLPWKVLPFFFLLVKK